MTNELESASYDAPDMDGYTPTITSHPVMRDVLTILCFNSEVSREIVGFLKPRHFSDDIFNIIATAAFRDFLEHDDSPGDRGEQVFAPLFYGPDGKPKPNAETIQRKLNEIYDRRELANNPSFCKGTVDNARKLVSHSNVLLAASRALETLRGDVDLNKVSNVVASFDKLKDLEVAAFDPGLNMGDTEAVLAELKHTQEDVLPVEWRPENERTRDAYGLLDRWHAGPVRGGLHFLIASTGMGKSWWLPQIGHASIMNGLKVLHITLEMSRKDVLTRYIQKFHRAATIPGVYQGSVFVSDDKQEDRARDSSRYDFHPAFVMDNKGEWHDHYRKLADGGWNEWQQNLRIKHFPTGSLTAAALEAYLIAYQRQQGFYPDLIIIDYADLMNHAQKGMDFRQSLGNLFALLRGIAGKYNVAVATATQANRESSKTGDIDEHGVAEDWSKMFTADTVLSYSAKQDERRVGIARLDIVKSRNARKQEFCITQNYSHGQFMEDCRLRPYDYDGMIKRANQ